MSTGCQIEFVFVSRYNDERWQPIVRTEKCLIYRHSDGYAEGFIPDMVEFLRWINGRYNSEYTPANFIYWAKCDSENHFGGYGICEPNAFNYDIAYFYTCTFDNSRVVIVCHQVRRRSWDKPMKRTAFKSWGTVTVLINGTCPEIEGFVEKESPYTDGRFTKDLISERLHALDERMVQPQQDVIHETASQQPLYSFAVED